MTNRLMLADASRVSEGRLPTSVVLLWRRVLCDWSVAVLVVVRTAANRRTSDACDTVDDVAMEEKSALACRRGLEAQETVVRTVSAR